MTNYKQLCAELIDALDSGIPSVRIRNSPLASRARAALAEPTDEQLLRTYALALTSVVDDAPKPWPDDLVNRAQIAGLRAVLARWGSHVLQPIPVSEPLPKPEDCDAEGTCWWWHPDHPESDYAGGWMQRPGQWGAVRYDSDDALVYTHWLPAHALPLPTHD